MWGEQPKKILRLLLKLGYRHLKTSESHIEKSLEYTPNPAIKNINKGFLAGVNQIKPKYQRQTAKAYTQLAIWIVTKDTAYRDLFFWVIYQILKRADKLLPLIEPYVKEPKDWYMNTWVESKDKTKKLKKEGKIPDYAKSKEEQIYTPALQKKRLAELTKRK